MRVERCSEDTSWYARVILDDVQWPPTDEAGDWMERPIRQWVYRQCYPVFFTASGWILFGNKDDLVEFLLTWS